MNKKIYLSGKMTGLPNNGYELFDKNRDFLIDLGHEVISPADIDRSIGINPTAPFTEEQYHETIKRDYAALLECDSIAFLNNWTESRGAKLESDFANILKLDRYRVDADNSYFEKEIIVALTGFARAGKNTIAEEFVMNDGFEQRGFADSIKDILYGLNYRVYVDESQGIGIVGYIPIASLVDTLGWEEAKKIPEVRQSLQKLGMEERSALGEDIWINTLFSQPHKARLVISDLRLENEAEEVRRRGGVIVRVIRDGVGPANDHVTEQINFDADITIFNNGTPKESYMQIIEQLTKFGINL